MEKPCASAIRASADWGLPDIRTAGELSAWLGIRDEELAWFADLRRLEFKQGRGRLSHYHYRIVSKRFGTVRLLEAPKPRLKSLQRQILADLLDRVPPHEAAHGFRRGRSIKTFALPHVGQDTVLRIDLENFFPSLRTARVEALFRALGYPERVADLLAGLCTNSAPLEVWDRASPPMALERIRDTRWSYAQPHLPQGAPTSPALANLCAFRLDCRLARLAQAAGATYTRYADDLAFSGGRGFARAVNRFRHHVAATASEEGFAVNYRKTRIMRQGVCQRLAGVVVNSRLNVGRMEYDRLKALLTNCLRRGAASQNRAGHKDFRAHLLGRISFVEMVNTTRGAKLRAIFDRIDW